MTAFQFFSNAEPFELDRLEFSIYALFVGKQMQQSGFGVGGIERRIGQRLFQLALAGCQPLQMLFEVMQAFAQRLQPGALLRLAAALLLTRVRVGRAVGGLVSSIGISARRASLLRLRRKPGRLVVQAAVKGFETPTMHQQQRIAGDAQ